MAEAVLRHSSRDALLVVLAVGHGVLVVAVPSAPLIAVMLWWNANTIAHNFIHLPFFRSRAGNRAFSLYLSLLLALPQTIWRDRHLAHHAGRTWRLRWSRQLLWEVVAVAALWTFIASFGPHFLLGTWLAGWLGGLVLCQLQGHYEHVRGTVSHYGALYNLLFFNDGYHVEHHTRPTVHWSALSRATRLEASQSRWPAVLRWLELFHLDALERIVLRSRRLQRFVVDRHARAFRKLLAGLPPIRRVGIVGGGLFPRTVLVMRKLLPAAEITVVDRSPENLRRARPYFDSGIRVVEASYAPGLCDGVDLLIVPLAFSGDRRRFYADPPAPAVAIHDWIWKPWREGCVVSPLLLKRLNLVRR